MNYQLEMNYHEDVEESKPCFTLSIGANNQEEFKWIVDNLVVFRSGSKFWGLPNHRVGYVFANKEIIKVYNAISLPFSFSDYSCRIFENVLKDYEPVLRH